MNPTERLTTFKVIVQQLPQILAEMEYTVPESYRWGIMINRIFSVSKTCVSMTSLSLENSPYQEMLAKLELALYIVGDPTIP